MSRKYIYSNILIILIPCLILAIAYFLKFQQIIQNEICLSYEQIMNQYLANIDYKLDLYRNIQESFSNNGRVQEILEDPNEVTSLEIMKFIDGFSKDTKNIFLDEKKKEVYNIALYSYNENVPYDGAFLKSIKYAKNEGWFRESQQSKNFYNCYFEMQPQKNQSLLLLSQPILRTDDASFSEPLGIIQINLYADWVFKPTNSTSKDKKMDIYILDKQGNIVYGDNTKSESINNLLKNNKSDEIIKDKSNHKILICRTISPYNWKAIAVFSYDEINSKVSAFITFSSLVVLVILIIFFGLTVSFSHIFIKRIHLLIKKMKNIEGGDFKIADIIEGDDEVGLLDKQFNIMTNRLNILINENYIQQIEKKEAELNALQLQINPHFLYNTLESISAIAAVNDCYEICSISQKLGEMFRYNINSIKSEFVPLRDEIEHIKNYIFIQKIRFEDRFEVTYDIPDPFLDCKVIKFILQPIIENALIHGLEDKLGKGRILISAKVNEDILCLMVEDDGVGIPSEKVEQMNAEFNEIGTNPNQKENSKRSIGLRNVNTRIKLVNGNKYGITIRSKLLEGTIVTISLPYYCRSSSSGETTSSNGKVSI